MPQITNRYKNKYYTVDGFSDGIAFYVVGPVMLQDEDYEWTGIETPDPNMVRAVMVGDDYEHTVDKSDLKPLDEEDFCHGCGQVGCGWH
jgi:hypothetical protein